ncbi:hypothetical protein QTN94_14340 [Vibrio sp. M250220]|uniref:hypothetical protein n=1 Tax=Vibrio sp. M250220 TaxID=3020894 RepID=UPI002F42C92A
MRVNPFTIRLAYPVAKIYFDEKYPDMVEHLKIVLCYMACGVDGGTIRLYMKYDHGYTLEPSFSGYMTMNRARYKKDIKRAAGRIEKARIKNELVKMYGDKNKEG